MGVSEGGGWIIGKYGSMGVWEVRGGVEGCKD